MFRFGFISFFMFFFMFNFVTLGHFGHFLVGLFISHRFRFSSVTLIKVQSSQLS